ncbi:hypothetical protein [Pedobacter soli]|uniref:Uncharacterized protein n=1 Tax=Pedobacter soli TaxID=390242 RepID=A0A1G6MFI9_9SPHI|nr:hypothetical protein [Pedobacter soli]SDC53746.1 hypothetical protein SAMN04488024_102307 [Pedobacter soli]
MLAGAQPFAVFFEVIFFDTAAVANIHRCRFGTSGVGKKEEDDLQTIAGTIQLVLF